MVAAISQLARRRSLGFALLFISCSDILLPRRNHLFLDYADAEASLFPNSNPWPWGIWCCAWPHRHHLVNPASERPHTGHLLVHCQGRHFYVPVHLVPGHFPALSL